MTRMASGDLRQISRGKEDEGSPTHNAGQVSQNRIHAPTYFRFSYDSVRIVLLKHVRAGTLMEQRERIKGYQQIFLCSKCGQNIGLATVGRLVLGHVDGAPQKEIMYSRRGVHRAILTIRRRRGC